MLRRQLIAGAGGLAAGLWIGAALGAAETDDGDDSAARGRSDPDDDGGEGDGADDTVTIDIVLTD